MASRSVRSLPDSACMLAVLLPRALTVAPTPTPAVVSFSIRVTPTAPPTPAAPRPTARVPSTTSVSVWSVAMMRTLPSASTTEPVPVVALVTLVIDSTEVEPATPTVPATPRPAAMERISSCALAITDTSLRARTSAESPTLARVVCLATSTSAAAPMPTAPAPEAEPAMPIW